MTFKDKLLIYIVNKSDRIDTDYEASMRTLRYYSADCVDLLEAVISRVRRDTFREVTQDIMQLLQLPEYKNRKE